MILESLIERIIAALEAEAVPWRGLYGFPANALTRKPYDPFTALVLNVASLNRGFQSRYWATLTEWRGMGVEVRPRPVHVESGTWGSEILVGELPRTVYNLDQIDGYVYALRTDIPSPDYKGADRFIKSTGAKIIYRLGMQCFYWYPPMDRIIFPLREHMENGRAGRVGFFHTMFHELIHWTSPSHRLNWHHGDEAIRELRSEIGADFLCTHFGLPCMPVYPPNGGTAFRQTHLRLMPRWIELMGQDPSMIVRTANDAAKAVEFLLACKKPAPRPKATRS